MGLARGEALVFVSTKVRCFFVEKGQLRRGWLCKSVIVSHRRDSAGTSRLGPGPNIKVKYVCIYLRILGVGSVLFPTLARCNLRQYRNVPKLPCVDDQGHIHTLIFSGITILKHHPFLFHSAYLSQHITITNSFSDLQPSCLPHQVLNIARKNSK